MSDDIITAESYGLLFGERACDACRQRMPTVALWVPSYKEHDDEGLARRGGPAVLNYIEWLHSPVHEHLEQLAPWVRLAPTAMSGQTYLVHHCSTCGAIQGDHYVFGVDGPYWPQDDKALARLRFVPGNADLSARAAASESSWMDLVEQVASRS